MSEFLKCDADGCDHKEVVETITADMVDKPCPKCGASLLTESDWQYWSTVMAPALDTMKKLGLVTSAEPESAGAVRVNYHNGELRLRMRDTDAA